VGRPKLRIVLAFAIVAVPICAGLWVQEQRHARREAAAAIRTGMDRPEVVGLLGVLYDDCRPGEYADVDATLSQMENRMAISRVANWRLSFSRNQLWFGFGDDGKVVSILMKERGR
jgi:hypothetical protein